MRLSQSGGRNRRKVEGVRRQGQDAEMTSKHTVDKVTGSGLLVSVLS